MAVKIDNPVPSEPPVERAEQVAVSQGGTVRVERVDAAWLYRQWRAAKELEKKVDAIYRYLESAGVKMSDYERQS